MSDTTIVEVNKECINGRMKEGLELLQTYYRLIPVDVGEFGQLHIQQMDYYVYQFDVRYVGNLLVMICPESDQMQMDSFVLTPYYKNLPMFSTDYIYRNGTRFFLNEIYSLVIDEDSTYKEYIEKFRENKEKHSALNDMPVKACWYDNLRPVCIAKSTNTDNDKESFEIFRENLETWISMERDTSFLTKTQYQKKWEKTKAYTDGLVDNGGVSTDVFKQAMGAEKTKEFFNRVFFAPSLYKL